jgi:hypothetical protein
MITLEPGVWRTAAIVWGALTVTTLINTTLPLLAPMLGLEPVAREARDWILIGHAVLGLLSSWYFALALLSYSAGAAGAGLLFAFIERAAELAGQILIVFTVHRGWRAELALAIDPVRRTALESRIGLFNDLWDDTFLVFWVGNLLSNLCWLRAARRAPGRGLRAALLIMAVLTAALIAEDYAGQTWLRAPLRFCYPLLLTGSRAWIARWLYRLQAAPPMAS